MLGLAILRVSVYRGGDLIGAENFRIRHIIVGRDPTMADLVIGSGKVSREHALVEHDGSKVFVHDLQSTNGIFINGLRVDRAEVGPTDVILLGEHFLRLELRGRAHTPEPLPDEPSLDDAQFPSLAAVDAIDEEVVDMARPIPVPAALAKPVQGDDLPPFQRDAEAEEEAWQGPSFPLVERLLDDQPRIDAHVPLRRLRLAILKTRDAQALNMQLLRPGRRFQAPAVALKERWGAAARSASPLLVRWTAKGQADVQVLERSRWTLRRGVGLWDETAGVREGWARRRRGGVWVTLQRNEMLAVSVGAVTYSVRFVPAPVAVLSPHGRRRPPSAGRLRWALGISGLLHALVVGALALHAYLAPPALLAPPVSWIPRDDLAPVLVALPAGVASAEAAAAPFGASAEAPSPSEGPEGRRLARPPGGSQGYRFFGLIDAPISYDPQVPAPVGGLVFKRAAAFLRGDGTGLGQLIPHSGAGPQWRWVADPQGISSSDPGRITPQAANTLVAQNSAALQSCYERFLPRDAGLSGRVSLSWQVSGSGGVRTVYPGPQLVEPPLLGCLTEAIKRWRYTRFNGSDVTLSYTLVFKREGFE